MEPAVCLQLLGLGPLELRLLGVLRLPGICRLLGLRLPGIFRLLGVLRLLGVRLLGVGVPGPLGALRRCLDHMIYDRCSQHMIL